VTINPRELFYISLCSNHFIFLPHADESLNRSKTTYGQPKYFDIVKAEYKACREAGWVQGVSRSCRSHWHVFFLQSRDSGKVSCFLFVCFSVELVVVEFVCFSVEPVVVGRQLQNIQVISGCAILGIADYVWIIAAL